MALFNGIKIDGTIYDVRIKYDSLKLNFEIIEGRNTGTSLKYRKIRDIQGTGYSYEFEVEPNPANRAAFDNFFNKISEPTDYHEIELPFKQGSLQMEAYITNGSMTFGGYINGQAIWKSLKVVLTYIAPVRLS